MRLYSIKISFLILGLLTITCGVQAQQVTPADTLRLLANPQRAAHTFVHWQMKGHERLELAATTMLSVPELTEEERIERAKQLLRVLDSRGLLIEFDRIPSDPAFEDSLSGLHQFILFNSLPQIYLEKQGNLWLFSRASVEAIPDIYRSTFSIFVDVVLDNMPGSWHKEWLGLAVWQYLALFLWLLSGLVIRKVAEFILETYVHKLTKKTETQWDDYLVESAKKPVSFILMLLFFKVSSTNLMFSVNINFYLNWLLDILLSFSFVWLFYGLVNVITGFLSDITSKTKSQLDEQLVPLLGKTLKVFVVVVGVLFIVQNSGYNVASVLAGLGIGGLAVALAARDTLANFFGSVTIFLDKPFQIGHWVNINGQEGIVEEVGFRTTRIRTFYNSVISVPNSTIANTAVDNLGMRQYRRVLTRLNLTYNTPPEQLEAFVEAIKGLVRSNPKMRQDFMEVHFNEFGSHSLDILIYVFLKVPTWSEELQEKHNFFMEILKAAKEVGVEFAFPTQTLHIDSFHKDTPREAGERKTDEELVSTVWMYGPHGDPKRKGGPRLMRDGKEINF
ncbi:MAG: mechanosensitive ion channel family protein [Bacteroidetes bacterium]|nr:mechanosensitive ion channel family protein [Bacteroidota bacterium]MCH8523419.1 mechanosensitive ion channel family protein [Balneolales bacterium]